MKNESVAVMVLAVLLMLAAIVQCGLIVRSHRKERARQKAANRSTHQRQLTTAFAGLEQLREREQAEDHEKTFRSGHGGDIDGGDVDGGNTNGNIELAKPSEDDVASRPLYNASKGAWIAMLSKRLGNVVLRAGLSYKIRLLISFLQVICSLDAVYQLSFPTEIVQFMRQIEVRPPCVMISPRQFSAHAQI